MPSCIDGDGDQSGADGNYNAILKPRGIGMSHPITIDKMGRIVVPSEVRRRLNLAPGSRLMLEVVAHRIELTPEPQAEPELLVKAGRRTVLRPTGKSFDAAAATRAERVAQSKRGSPG